jgi:hypothetical protein
MKKRTVALIIAMIGGAASTQQARATPCLTSPSCTLDGQTFTTTGGTSGGGLTFIANFTTPNQSNSAIATLVTDYLALLGDNVTYLGRQDGSGHASGIVSITTSPWRAANLSGTWSLNPGSTGFVGSFVAIHAGSGQTDDLFLINSPGTSGTWATNNGHGLSNFDLFGTKSITPAPEPASMTLLGAGLVGLGLARGKLFGRRQPALG